MPDISDMDRMLVEHACERLALQFAALNDAGRYDELAALFEPAGVLVRPFPPFRRCQGPLEIEKDMRSTAAGAVVRHVCTNVLIDVETPTQAKGVVYFTVYRQDGASRGDAPLDFSGITYLGEYRDRYVRTANGWRFAHRETCVTHRLGGAA